MDWTVLYCRKYLIAGLGPFIFLLIFKFKFIDFKKLNSNSLNLKKLNSNSNSLTLQKSNSNSSITRERIQFQIQPNPTFHRKHSKRILQFATKKSQSRCVLAHHRCVINQQLKLLESRIRYSAVANANEVRGYQPKVGGH